MTVTADILSANPWINSLIDDLDGQIQKFGVQAFGRGPFPDLISKFVPGSPEEDAERERLRQIALSEPDPTRRASALADIRHRLGAAPTSQTLQHVSGSAGDWPIGR